MGGDSTDLSKEAVFFTFWSSDADLSAESDFFTDAEFSSEADLSAELFDLWAAFRRTANTSSLSCLKKMHF